jgi:hypothetical protein
MLKNRARAMLAATSVALVAAIGVGAGTATAAKAPKTFYGVVPQTSIGKSDLERMGQGKVGSMRTILQWSAVDATAADDNDWAGFDALVLEAARNGIEVRPFVFGTPEWVAKGIDNANCNNAASCVLYPPKSGPAVAEWGRFIGEAVERYGANGELWTENPGVPKQPIEVWQLWNEMNSKSFYAPKPSPKGYAKLLSAGSDAIAKADPSAEVVLGGLPELAGSRKATPGSKYLEALYKVKGVKSDFDGVAAHPYGATVGKVTAQVEAYREIMKKAGDKGASMYVTEVGAGSAKGGNPLNRGEKGQAKLLKDVYKQFTKKRRSWKIQSVDWFSWQDSGTSICSWCASSGLLTQSGAAKRSYKEFTKLTGGSTGKRKR